MFTADDTDLAVKVQVSDSPRPQYSVEIGRMYNGKFLRFLRPNYSTLNGVISVRLLDAAALGRLFVRAEALICLKIQVREDEWQEKRRAREVWQTEDRAPAPRRTGKTARTRAKRVRREQRRQDDC